MSDINVLSRTVCVLLSVSLWSGRRRLRKEDIGDDAKKLPPEDLASLGSLKLCDPEQLRKLNSIKRAAEREVLKHAVRFLGGYATDRCEVDTITSILEKHKAEFLSTRQAFLDGLNSDIDEWVAKHPQWEHLIRKAIPDPSYVASRLQFTYQLFSVQPVGTDAGAPATKGLSDATVGLAGQLFREIEQEASDAWEKSFSGRSEVGQKALRPIRAMQTKLQTLRFLDRRTGPVIDRIQSVLSSLPKSGKIEGNDLSAVTGLLHLLCNAQRMKEHGRRALEGVAQDEELSKESGLIPIEAGTPDVQESQGGPESTDGELEPVETNAGFWL